MVHWHARMRPRLRVAGGLLGFTLALAAVTLVGSRAARASPDADAPAAADAWLTGGRNRRGRGRGTAGRVGPDLLLLTQLAAVLAPRALRVAGRPAGYPRPLPSLPQLNLAPPSPWALAAVLLLVALCGVCDGLAQGALFGEVALLPPRYTQALVAGTAVSGGRRGCPAGPLLCGVAKAAPTAARNQPAIRPACCVHGLASQLGVPFFPCASARQAVGCSVGRCW